MNESNNVNSREVFLCLMGSIAILSLSLSCSSFWDEKPCDFTSKCSGKDYIILCENQGHMWEDYEPVAYKCSEGTFCLEDGQYADCVISDIPCPEGSWTFCNNNEIYYCSFIKYAYESQPCSKNLPFCIDVAAKDANGPYATCSVTDERCTDPNVERCFFADNDTDTNSEVDTDEPPDAGLRSYVLVCDPKGAWKVEDSCGYNRVCQEKATNNLPTAECVER